MTEQYVDPNQYYTQGYYPQMQQMDDKWRFDTSKILNDFRHSLLGEIPTAEGKYIKIGEPLMNKTGVEKVMSNLSLIINPNTLMSYLEKREIYAIMRQQGFAWNAFLYLNGEDFEIHPLNVRVLLNSILDFIFMTLKRAQDAGERKSLSQVYQESVIRQETGGKKDSFRVVPNIFGRKKQEQQVVYG